EIPVSSGKLREHIYGISDNLYGTEEFLKREPGMQNDSLLKSRFEALKRAFSGFEHELKRYAWD
ncbi:MAG: hypothetical protein WC824_14020, partial [Bacteroidota bacterium]